MRKLYTLLTAVIITASAFAQNVGINSTGATPNAAFILDIDATDNGLLIPPLTVAQRTALNPLPTAAQGLLIYQIDAPEGFYYNTSTTTIPNRVKLGSGCDLAIGDTHQGGKIFYLDASGCHGLISAPTDQSTGIQWYNDSNTYTTAVASCVGCGDGNTSMIVYQQGTGSYAAQVCNDLQITQGGVTYEDWYLPSKYELNLMYENIGQGNTLRLGNVGGFTKYNYWSSTEGDDGHAWNQIFFYGYQSYYGKDATFHLRAVRAF